MTEYIISSTKTNNLNIEKIRAAFGMPKAPELAKDVYTAGCLFINWTGKEEFFQRIMSTAKNIRIPIYEILHEGTKIRYIRRLPTKK